MQPPRTVTLTVNEHVLLRDTPIYSVLYPRMPFDHLILELSFTPMLLPTLTTFGDLWHTQRAADWSFSWSDQALPQNTTACLHAFTLTYYPQALLQLILAPLPASGAV